VRLFEIATSFRCAGSGEAPLEENHLAAVLTGLPEPSHWSSTNAPIDIWDLKTLVDETAARAYRGQATVDPAEGELSTFEPGAAYVVRDGAGREVGQAGRVRADLVDAPVWAGDVWGLELALPEEVIPPPVPVYRRLPQYPAVERDLALLVPDGVPAQAVLDAIGKRGGNLLEEVSLFDHYRGEGVPVGARSVAFGLRFRSPDRTLKDKEVDRAVTAIIGFLKEELGVEPRG
jgi:phenylalanyl-tRNA synthetase beta chain